jgi:competence protein ComEC
VFQFLKSKLTPKFILGALVAFTLLVWLAVFSFPSPEWQLTFCDVGQGDAILLSRGFEQMLIDGGPNDQVLKCLANHLPFFDRTIEIVALTHPEADHLTGLVAVLRKYQVKYFLSSPIGNESAAYAALLEELKKQNPGPRVVNPYEGDKIKLSGLEISVLWPQRAWLASQLTNCQLANCQLGERVLGMSTDKNLNDFSLVFLLRRENFTALLMGDADSRVQDEIMTENNLPAVNLLKFPHHGSKTGLAEDFLSMIKPKEAVISVGKNSYGHPTKEALELLKKYGVRVKRTDLEGEIHYTIK